MTAKLRVHFVISCHNFELDAVLAHVPDELMPKFAETVNFVWKYLKCRRSEKFSPDLLWRIAYPFVADEFGEVTNDWLDRMLKECETAKNAEGKEKCHIRCAVINERVKILYTYHNWLYAACRKEYDCCEEERYLAKAEPGRKHAPRPHFSPLLTQKSLDAVKRNASKINSSSGESQIENEIKRCRVLKMNRMKYQTV